MSTSHKILLGGISLPFYAAEGDIIAEAKRKMKWAGYSPAALCFRIYKRSVDARHKDDIKVTCSVLAEGLEHLPDEATLKKINAKPYDAPTLEICYGSERLDRRPLVVGTGPAGMFCALMLARHGYAPIVIERGGCVADRVKSVERFCSEQVLDSDSNIQFGAGGAGTFSDGKLITRISDARCALVLEALHKFGAPEDILTQAKPHIGTDILQSVSHNLLCEIERLGGEVIYNCRLDDFIETEEGIVAKTTKGNISCGLLVLAVGHSARDTYKMLEAKSFAIQPKAFSVGVRIEHLQDDIDRALYGKSAGDARLGPAEYALSDTRGERGVYTFCMCPGGEVAAAASETGGVVVNGMSRRARDGKNANCAVAVSVLPEDYGNTPQGAVDFQRRIEKAAFAAGGGDYYAPMQTVGDFLCGMKGSKPDRVRPTYMGGRVRCADLSQVLPDFVTKQLRYGLVSFGRKIEGFDSPQAILTGAETRTSAPIRVLRGEQLTALGHNRIYPCGEGAGYAGGITSAAVDGIRTAVAIMEKYSARQ